MRRLFIVGAKLLGLVCLYWAISVTLHIMPFVSSIVIGTWNDKSKWIIVVLVSGAGLLAYAVLTVWFASVLLFRTCWLAEKVGFGEDSELPGWPEEHKLLSLGIVLIGLYILVAAIPGIAKSSLSLLNAFWHKWPPGYPAVFSIYVIPVLTNILVIAIGLLLMLMPERIIQWIEKMQKTLEQKLTKPEENVEKSDEM